MKENKSNKDILIQDDAKTLASKEVVTINIDSAITKEIKKAKISKKKILKKICIICGKKDTDGILILDKKICNDCEKKAITADINSEFYEGYKEKILKNVVGKLKKLG
ncbi:MAG: sigma factor G inhibitor Gin [Sarcina sp.]